MSDATTFDPDALRKEFADYCTEVEPGIKAHAPKLNQLETLALIGMTLFQAAKELKDEKSELAARIAELESASKDAIRREALEAIANQDPVEMALDPTWAKRIASAALSQKVGDQQ